MKRRKILTLWIVKDSNGREILVSSDRKQAENSFNYHSKDVQKNKRDRWIYLYKQEPNSYPTLVKKFIPNMRRHY